MISGLSIRKGEINGDVKVDLASTKDVFEEIDCLLHFKLLDFNEFGLELELCLPFLELF